MGIALGTHDPVNLMGYGSKWDWRLGVGGRNLGQAKILKIRIIFGVREGKKYICYRMIPITEYDSNIKIHYSLGNELKALYMKGLNFQHAGS